MATQTLPCRAPLKTHGSLLRELEKSEDYTAQNFDLDGDDEECRQRLKAGLSKASSEIKVTKPAVPLESFVGLKEVKRDILCYLDRSAPAAGPPGSWLSDRNLEGNDRILIFGESGTGHLVRAIATELRASLITVEDAIALFKWESNMDLYTQTLYEICQTKGLASTIIFLDYLDASCVRDDEKRAVVRFIQTVQSTWAKIENLMGHPPLSSRLVVFGSTNKPNLLDEKLVYGFDKRVYIPTLNFSERKQLFQRTIQKSWQWGHKMELKDVDWVARKTYGILTSEIETIVEKAVRVQYPKWSSTVEKQVPQQAFDSVTWRALEVGDFVEVLRGFLVLESKTFFEYETFQRKFGNGPFMRIYDREDYSEDGSGGKGKKKANWMWTAISWL